RHTRFSRDWSSDVCSSDLAVIGGGGGELREFRQRLQIIFPSDNSAFTVVIGEHLSITSLQRLLGAGLTLLGCLTKAEYKLPLSISVVQSRQLQQHCDVAGGVTGGLVGGKVRVTFYLFKPVRCLDKTYRTVHNLGIC